MFNKKIKHKGSLKIIATYEPNRLGTKYLSFAYKIIVPFYTKNRFLSKNNQKKIFISNDVSLGVSYGK